MYFNCLVDWKVKLHGRLPEEQSRIYNPFDDEEERAQKELGMKVSVSIFLYWQTILCYTIFSWAINQAGCFAIWLAGWLGKDFHISQDHVCWKGMKYNTSWCIMCRAEKGESSGRRTREYSYRRRGSS